jgi:hypothetical protein
MCDRCNKMLHMSIQVQRRTPGLPCAMALRLIRNRPGDRLSCHHRPLEALASHELDASTGASDPNDFTVRISPFVSRADASTATCPTSATTADAPWWDRIAGVRLLICPTGQQEYFCAKGWTDFCATAVICPSGYFVAGIYRCAHPKQCMARRVRRRLEEVCAAAGQRLAELFAPAANTATALLRADSAAAK